LAQILEPEKPLSKQNADQQLLALLSHHWQIASQKYLQGEALLVNCSLAFPRFPPEQNFVCRCEEE